MGQAVHADVVSAPYSGNHTIFLSGVPGSGKTTLAIRRLRYLLEQGIPAEQILVLVPQRTLGTPYYQALRSAASPPGGLVDIATIGGLARRTLELFWPLVSGPAGFAQPERPPRFLTLETAQYHMDRIVESSLASGAFDGITIPRARLVSQVIDNLNKAAAVGFPLEEIAARLSVAWGGESARRRIYDQVQAAALAFRRACLAQNLLDWSLQIEAFQHHLLPHAQFRRYLLSGYRHLIVDNIEEDIPATHDLLRRWLLLCESALLVHDADGGFRVFLGAHPEGARSLANLCRRQVLLTRSYVTPAEVAALGSALTEGFASTFRPTPPDTPDSEPVDPRRALILPPGELRFHPQMLDWVVAQISRLVQEEAMPPGEIAVLAPYLSDALRFSLIERLDQYHIPARSHRPSRQLREEPAARCLLTLVRLAHPTWRRPPHPADVAEAFAQSIADLDPVRARLLTDIVYRVREGQPTLAAFHQIVPETQQRISYLLGGRYDELRCWIQDYDEHSRLSGGGERLDYFLSRLFGEVLSQAGFGFHHDLDAGATAANLIESVHKFRQGFSSAPGSEDNEGNLGREYVEMVERGVVAAQYVSSWRPRQEDAVLLAPAYTFLMMNQAVSVQFWLDAGSRAWFERIYQPLTHPYVLSRDWPEGRVWSDEDEVRVREQALARLVLGLTRRCRQRIYLAYCELNERGYEQQGPLLQSVQHLLRRGGGRD